MSRTIRLGIGTLLVALMLAATARAADHLGELAEQLGRAVATWIRGRGWFGDVTIGNVQFGYEITSSAGGRDFVTNSFSVTG